MKTAKICNSLIKGVRCRAPSILTGFAIAGTFLAVRQSAKDTTRLADNLEVAKKKKKADLTKIDILKVKAKTYVPTIAYASISVGCMLASNKISTRRIASATAYSAIAEERLERLKKSIQETVPDETSKDICKSYDQKMVEDHPISKETAYKNKFVRNPDTLFYEEFTGRYFYSTDLAVKSAEYELNRLFACKGYASLNDFYSLLGLPNTAMGYDTGWNIDYCADFDGINWIDFVHCEVISGDELCYVIKYDWQPSTNFMGYIRE